MSQPISPPSRYSSGRKKRMTVAERLNELNEAEARKVKAVVLAQPHRRGSYNPEDPALESALGRFVLRYGLARECIDAGNLYARTYGQWLSMVRAPKADHIGGTGNPPDDETVDKWDACLKAWRKAMRDAGGSIGVIGAVGVIVHGVWPDDDASTLASIDALATCMGKLPKHT